MESRTASRSACPSYTLAEETINICSHALGALLSMIALIFLLLRSSNETSPLAFVSFSVYGVSLVLLYVISTLYHSCKIPRLREKLRIFDHAVIFVLIAGTYTPFTLVTLQGWVGWLVFGITWILALAGTALKLIYTGRFQHLSTGMYVLMGWLIVFVMIPLSEKLPLHGIYWLLAGGLIYSTGAVLYSIRRIPFNHAIFHCMVLLGSICHFVSVYYYVLPG